MRTVFLIILLIAAALALLAARAARERRRIAPMCRELAQYPVVEAMAVPPKRREKEVWIYYRLVLIAWERETYD